MNVYKCLPLICFKVTVFIKPEGGMARKDDINMLRTGSVSVTVYIYGWTASNGSLRLTCQVAKFRTQEVDHIPYKPTMDLSNAFTIVLVSCF